MHMHYIYTKNQFMSADTPFITAEDRSFRFGDGIFETMLVVDGRLYDAHSHFERLNHGLDYFRIRLPMDELEETCLALIAKNNCQSGYVRIVVSRGENAAGAVGYMPGESPPLLVVQTMEKSFPAYASLKLWVSAHRAHLKLPCKTNSAMLYTMAMMEARDCGCDNALILSTQDEICETASGNLFWVKDDVLFTPATSLPFVPGTVRRKVLELAPMAVKEGRFVLADLAAADEIFMTNIGGLVTRISSIAPLGYQATTDRVTAKIRHLVETDISVKTQGRR